MRLVKAWQVWSGQSQIGRFGNRPMRNGESLQAGHDSARHGEAGRSKHWFSVAGSGLEMQARSVKAVIGAMRRCLHWNGPVVQERRG